MGSGSGAEKKQTPPCKSGRGTCSAHYIREDVLRELVLERIRAVNELIRGDAEGFQEEWLCCRRADQEKSIRNDRREQEQLKAKVAESEDWLKKQQDMSDGIDNFLALTRKYVDVEELTQTIVNEYIRQIDMYAPDKSSGHRQQKIKIIFNFVGYVGLGDVSEPVTYERTPKCRKRRDLSVTPSSAGK